MSSPPLVEDAVPRGGFRGTPGVARFTAQLVSMVTPDVRRRVLAMAKRHQVSQSKILRAVVDEGLPGVEKRLANGDLRPDTLA